MANQCFNCWEGIRVLPISNEPDYSSVYKKRHPDKPAAVYHQAKVLLAIKGLAVLAVQSTITWIRSDNYNFENTVVKVFIHLFASIIHVSSKKDALVSNKPPI